MPNNSLRRPSLSHSFILSKRYDILTWENNRATCLPFQVSFNVLRKSNYCCPKLWREKNSYILKCGRRNVISACQIIMTLRPSRVFFETRGLHLSSVSIDKDTHLEKELSGQAKVYKRKEAPPPSQYTQGSERSKPSPLPPSSRLLPLLWVEGTSKTISLTKLIQGLTIQAGWF